MKKPLLHHIPVCPFSQRVEILLELKGLRSAVDFSAVDITKPRGATALPVLELEDGRILKESLVLLRYFDDRFPEPRVARSSPYERAVENMLGRWKRRSSAGARGCPVSPSSPMGGRGPGRPGARQRPQAIRNRACSRHNIPPTGQGDAATRK
jgi:glutathione S-transferase